MQNDLLNKDVQEPIDSSQPSYTLNKEQVGNLVRRAADNSSYKRVQWAQNEAPALNNTPELQDKGVVNVNANTCPLQEVFDIQLLHDINQTTEQDFQDDNFYSISLHSFLKHLLSNSKNIKELLCHMTNYIKNKNIDCTKTNNIPDLNGIGKVA